MFNRLLRLPLNSENSLFLFGPRGTGKTSWLKQHLPEAVYLDLLDFNIHSFISSNPSRIEQFIPPLYKGWIIIDEVQRVPELLNAVHRLIESNRSRFILICSSARSLRRRGVNLLAGRAFRYHMHPLIIQEIGPTFNLNRALQFGLLPMAVTQPDPKQYLENYVQTYLREEVQQEGLTRNIGAFNSFLEVASFSQGTILTMTEIGRELALSRFTVANYFAILEDLLISIRIPPFTVRAKRKMVSHEKFYFFDTGVYRVLRPMRTLDTQEETDGAALETLFLQSVRAINDYLNLGYKIYFWRTPAGNEVDFVLYGPHGLHAFELKRSPRITNQTLRGLHSFAKDYPEAKLHVLFLGTQTEYHDTIVARPFEHALRELPDLLRPKTIDLKQ